MSDTPLIGLPLIEASQAQKHVTHNEALLLLDVLVHLAVTSRSLATPPASPANGDRYLVAALATGAWAGHAGHIAFREAGSWRFAIPKPGWRLWVMAESLFLLFDGTLWFDVQSFDELQNLNLLGVNTTADATNKLAVSSASVLFNHAGAGSRVKVNKNAAGDTASLLFQTGFSGRAEFGLTGDDDFHVKVSPDGSAWNESLTVSRTSGLFTIRNGFALAPQSADPATPADGQLWYNSTTGTFRKRQGGVTGDLDAGGGSGDVAGPVGAADNALTRYDGASGKLVQNSSVTLSDNGELLLAAGGAADAPLKFQSGTNLATAETGAIEFDGTCFYGTSDAGNRGVIPLEHFIILNADFTLTNTAARQKAFNAPAGGTLALEAGLYSFEFLLYLTTMSATSGNLAFDILGAGSATISKALYYAVGIDSTTPAPAAAPSGSLSTAAQSAASIVTAATGTGAVASGRGMFRVSAGGTIIPSITLVTAAAAVMKDMSYFKCRRLGAAAAVSQGDWS